MNLQMNFFVKKFLVNFVKNYSLKYLSKKCVDVDIWYSFITVKTAYKELFNIFSSLITEDLK